MKRTRLILLYSLLLAGFLALTVSPALAQDPPTPDSTEAVQPGAVPVADAPTTADVSAPTTDLTAEPGDEIDDIPWAKLIEMLLQVITDFRTVGIVAGFVGIVGIFILLLRIRKINVWMDKKGIKHWKIYISAGLGGVLMFLTALGNGRSIVESVAAGVVGIAAGLTSVGVHNVGTKGNS